MLCKKLTTIILSLTPYVSSFETIHVWPADNKEMRTTRAQDVQHHSTPRKFGLALKARTQAAAFKHFGSPRIFLSSSAAPSVLPLATPIVNWWSSRRWHHFVSCTGPVVFVTAIFSRAYLHAWARHFRLRHLQPCIWRKAPYSFNVCMGCMALLGFTYIDPATNSQLDRTPPSPVWQHPLPYHVSAWMSYRPWHDFSEYYPTCS